MKPSETVQDFVRHALAQGRGRDDIAATLRDAGRSAAEVAAALDAWGDAPGWPPVPRPRAGVSAGAVVLYALMFVSLVMMTWHMVDLGFDLINRFAPRYQTNGPWWGDMSRWSMAALLTFTPLFLLLDRRAARAVRRDSGRRRAVERGWFATLALLLAALTLLGSFAVAVYALLTGALGVNVALKIGLVAVIALLVAGYYRDPAGGAAAVWALCVLAALLVGAGLAATGGPSEGRREARDDVRDGDLRAIERQAVCLIRNGGAVGDNLAATGACPEQVNLTDPFTGAPYRVERVDDTNLRLCAGFESRRYRMGGDPAGRTDRNQPECRVVQVRFDAP